jgi:hypothetical protein
LEQQLLVLLRNADAGVPHSDADRDVVALRADQLHLKQRELKRELMVHEVSIPPLLCRWRHFAA